MNFLLSLLGSIGVAASAPAGVAAVTQTHNQVTPAENTSISSAGKIYGLSEEGKATTILADFVQAVKDALAEAGNPADWELNDTHLHIDSTANEADDNYINEIVRDVISGDDVLISETYTTTPDGFGNNTVTIEVVYSNNGVETSFNLNGFHSALNDFQLETGRWNISSTLSYSEGSMDWTDSTNESAVKLPDLGFNYFAQQIEEMYTNNAASIQEALNYMANKTDIKTTDTVVVDGIYKAVAQEDGTYIMGEAYAPMDEIIEDYFYVSFTSPDIEGTFNLLVANR